MKKLKEPKNCTVYPIGQSCPLAYTATLTEAIATGLDFEQYKSESIARDAAREHNREQEEYAAGRE